MIRDITLGQYYPKESIIHRLDPRTKLFITFFYLISLFLANNKYMYLLAIVFLAAWVSLSKVPVKYIAKGLKGIMAFVVISVLINVLFTKGDTLVTLGFLEISKQGVRIGIYTLLRIVLLVMGSAVVTYTTTPTKLTDGLEVGLRFLKKIKVPVHEVSMMISVALRFIPILVEELDRVMKAQQARCADFESGNIVKRIKSLFPVIVPLFVSAIRRADDLANAMESRCYRGDIGRTRMYPLKYTKSDAIAYVIFILYLIGMIALRAALSQGFLEYVATLGK